MGGGGGGGMPDNGGGGGGAMGGGAIGDGGAEIAGLLNEGGIPPVGELGDPPLVGGGADFEAASMALARSSLSSPANMMPDSVPVKNVAMGMISSKNLLSTGLIPFMGCVTKIRLYRTTNTIPNKVSPSTIPIKNFNRALSSSVVYFSVVNRFLNIWCNLLC
jgi:hypothetical protein